ncbi:RING finger domain-containing protein [Ophiocordyceps camponoti-floridani]|uniref:RING finger domain-containing protein n=1 Tax=Ophiocordyceps camponoti-floridani TaxID=2030778 RepID=A0A8H4QAY1_9HYPO|nr:RING finger domain-containing protein [Ophiocordyceps camponoti-floridani]
MDHVVDHVVSPFCEIVNKGRAAVRNAAGSQMMMDTARSLIEEGARAVNRLEPVCRDNYVQFGYYFADALQRNDEIQHYRGILIGLVWDFDKYVDPAGFDPDKYIQLELQSRNAAVRIYTILTNMRVMLQSRNDRLLMSPPSSPLSSPGLPQPPYLQPPISSPVRRRPTDVDNARFATNELERLVRECHVHRDSEDGNADDGGFAAPRPESPVDPSLLQPEHHRRGHMPVIVRKPRPNLPTRNRDDGCWRPPMNSSDANPNEVPRRQDVEAAVSLEDMAQGLGAPSSAAPPGQGYPAVPPSPGLEVPEIRQTFDDGLIVVDTTTPKLKSTGFPSLGKHSTVSASSSFYQHKGFCDGARDVVKGEIGVKQIQKPVKRTLSRVVARCTGCSFELDNSKIEADMQRSDDGNFSTKAGITYRLRFLQKSHLAAKRSDDVPYGCVFCIHQGHTLDPSDATVFFTTHALFSHLARHPRPLPDVPGIRVVEEPEVPSALRNDYDIHLRGPQTKHPAHENQSDIAGRPTGVARAEARQMHNKRQPPDRSPALELAQGARIVGIRWPREYKGEWMFAWHDGAFESAPTDNVRLDPPPPSDIKMGGSSLVIAKARWKFAPRDKEKGEWLKFSKNETIMNISWPHREHWCWSGTNSRGVWGIFPRAFIDMTTVQEREADPLEQQVSSSPTVDKGRASVFTKLSVRKTCRPSSIAESTSSRDTRRTG